MPDFESGFFVLFIQLYIECLYVNIMAGSGDIDVPTLMGQGLKKRQE